MKFIFNKLIRLDKIFINKIIKFIISIKKRLIKLNK